MKISDDENQSSPPTFCVLCEGQMILVDLAGGAERPSLVSENFGKHFSRDALVPLERARACVECGHVLLFVDPVKLRRRIPRGR